MIILAIETSLDDTAAAVTKDYRVLSNIVASQVKYHAQWGGTVPDIARRKHEEWIELIIKKAIDKSGLKESQIEAVAVTYGPGLAPSLEVGIDHAKEWAQKLNKPLIPVNHLEAHLLACLATNSRGVGGHKLLLPALGFVISGGHTELILIKEDGDYQLLGETLDDAAGEAYDKVARMLQLGYPGGPILAELSKKGNPRFKLPTPMWQRNDLNFSFSGLKTAAMNELKKLEDEPHDRQFVADFSASFEAAVLKHLAQKFEMAVQEYKPKSIILGGGVVSNLALRKKMRQIAKIYNMPVLLPYDKKLITDNAGMIGITAFVNYQRNRVVKDAMKIERQPNLNFKCV